jgi:hypothetical protein
MAGRRKPTDRELLAFSTHLLYEIEMSGATMQGLAAIDPLEASNFRTTLRNALMESWALHVRNLLSFLYDTRAGKGDVIAADFIPVGWAAARGPKPEVLKLAHAKASKEMAHMSFVRSGLIWRGGCQGAAVIGRRVAARVVGMVAEAVPGAPRAWVPA